MIYHFFAPFLASFLASFLSYYGYGGGGGTVYLKLPI